jgi:hypothetical protein
MNPLDRAALEERKLQHEISKLEKEADKLEKEVEKAEKELSDLRKPHWKRPLTIAAFLPTFVAMLSLLIFASNGFFGVEIQRIQNEKFEAQKTLDLLKAARTKQAKDYRADSIKFEKKVQEAVRESKRAIEGYAARTKILSDSAYMVKASMLSVEQQNLTLRKKIEQLAVSGNLLQNKLYQAQMEGDNLKARAQIQDARIESCLMEKAQLTDELLKRKNIIPAR